MQLVRIAVLTVLEAASCAGAVPGICAGGGWGAGPSISAVCDRWGYIVCCCRRHPFEALLDHDLQRREELPSAVLIQERAGVCE